MVRRSIIIACGLALGMALVAGIAVASIPENGVYTGCYMKSVGTLRVIEPSQACKMSETRITWNQQGQPGSKGEQGLQGLPGPGAVMEGRVWCGDDGCPDAYKLKSSYGEVTLVTAQRPNGGAPPWDKTVAMATVSLMNYGGINNFEWVPVQCYTYPGQQAVLIKLQPEMPFSWAFTIPAEGEGSEVALKCRIQNMPEQSQDLSIDISEVTLTLVQASSINNINPAPYPTD